MDEKHQVVVIGAGPGGYAAAFLAAGRGLRPLLIDPEQSPGGVCLHRGCIPSKALLHAVRLLDETAAARTMGIHFAPPRIDLEQLRAWKESVVTRLTGGLAAQCKLRGVTLIRGRARLLSSSTLEILSPDAPPNCHAGGAPPAPPDVKVADASFTVKKIRFGKAILATGSRPALLPGIDPDLPGVMDSTAALSLTRIPATLLIVGGGNIGLELGSVYAALGSRVRVVEASGVLLPGADRDLVRPVAARLAKRFESIQLNARVTGLTPVDGGLRVQIGESAGATTTMEVERLLVAAGRRPMSDDLGLENTRVALDEQGAVLVDAGMSTTDPSILAIGDLTGGPMLAHKASMQARIAIRTLMGETPPTTRSPILPAVTYTDPELAWAGLTETAARERNIPVRAVRFPWAASGRAQTLERTEGVTKWILEPESGRILGIGITGVGAGELIAAGVAAIERGATAREMAGIVHPHPTLSETLTEAAEIFLGHCVHFHAPARTASANPPA